MTTLDYYNTNASSFISTTANVDFQATQDRFLSAIPDAAYILDFCCGSGRDTKYFLEKGYSVDATDGSEEICKMASAYAGIDVRNMLFQELCEKSKYDGIWACASILHLPKQELQDVMQKMVDALKEGGAIYTSFKYGTFEGERNGRFFTDFTIESFTEFLKDFSMVNIEEYWITDDVRPGREDEKWLNLILRKKIQ